MWEQFFREQRSALWGEKKKLRAAAGALRPGEVVYVVGVSTSSKAAMRGDIALLTDQRVVAVGDRGRIAWQIELASLRDVRPVGSLQIAFSTDTGVTQVHLFPTARIADFINAIHSLREDGAPQSEAPATTARVPLAAGSSAPAGAASTRARAEQWFAGQLSVMARDRTVDDFVEEFYADESTYQPPAGAEAVGKARIAASFAHQLRAVDGGRTSKKVSQIAVSPTGDFAVIQSAFEHKTAGRVRKGTEVTALHMDGNNVIAQTDSVPNYSSRMSSAAQWGIVIGALLVADMASDGFDLFGGSDAGAISADPSGGSWMVVDTAWIETWSVETVAVAEWYVWSA